MFDADGRIVLFNARYAKMMGIPAAWLKGLSLLDLIKRRKASGDFAGNPEEQFEQVIAGGAGANQLPGSWTRRPRVRFALSSSRCR